MQTITLQITNKSAISAIKDLEKRHFVKILEDSLLSSYSLPGSRLSIKQFKEWVKASESLPTVKFSKAKEKWASKKSHLENLTN